MQHNPALLNAILRSDLASFIKRSFNIINPSVKLLDNWHIDLIADYLTLATKGEIKRLIINMPPRALKSLSISIAWPAWLLGHDPSQRIIAASYSQTLSIRHAMDCKLLIASEWYKRLFPNMRISKSMNQKHKFLTTKNGFRFATSIAGTLTGDGGDFLIIDDPHKPNEIHSAKLRSKTIEWFEQTFATRLNNPRKGVIILVMQRLHPNDLSGHLLQQSQIWHHLNLPATAQNRITYYFKSTKPLTLCKLTTSGYKVQPNQLLHPKQLDHAKLKQLKQQIGNDNFAAQYMQSPVTNKIGMLSRKVIVHYSKLPAKPAFILQSWDTAIMVNKNSDFSVCSTWFVYQEQYYLVDILHQRLAYPQLKNHAIMLEQQYHPHQILIEDKASGHSLIQDLKHQGMLNIVPQKVKTDKLTRFAATIPLFETGTILLPKHAEWLEVIINELIEFPNSQHDDIVDSISHAINYLQYQYKPNAQPIIHCL